MKAAQKSFGMMSCLLQSFSMANGLGHMESGLLCTEEQPYFDQNGHRFIDWIDRLYIIYDTRSIRFLEDPASGLSSNLSPFTQIAECWSALACTYWKASKTRDRLVRIYRDHLQMMLIWLSTHFQRSSFIWMFVIRSLSRKLNPLEDSNNKEILRAWLQAHPHDSAVHRLEKVHLIAAGGWNSWIVL